MADLTSIAAKAESAKKTVQAAHDALVKAQDKIVQAKAAKDYNTAESMLAEMKSNLTIDFTIALSEYNKAIIALETAVAAHDAQKQAQESAQAQAAAQAAQQSSADPTTQTGGISQKAKPTKAKKLKAYEFPKDNDFNPQNVKIINASIGGSTGAKLVEMDGRRYIMKTEGAVSSEHIINEASADKMYRAAGIAVPDCKTYTVGGKTYKLAEFIDGGQSLGDYMATATEAQKKAIRKELLKGYQIDVALGNWDVCGMGKDNILVDKNGRPWRIDNGSAMNYRAQGAQKKPEEWANATFPDEWRTLRSGGNNNGVFDKYTAHDIFSQKVDWDKVLDAAPKSERAILEKRVSELKQMSARCEDFDRGGYIPEATDIVLETSYDLAKDGFREACPKTVSHGNYGFCRSGKTASGVTLPNKPQKPVMVKPSASTAQTGGQWDGTKFSSALSKAAKSINYHIAQGDNSPNSASVADALALESELKALAKTDKDAQDLLGKLNEIKASQANGFKDKIGMVNAYTLAPSPAALKAMQQAQQTAAQAQQTAQAKYDADMAQYQQDLIDWAKQCKVARAKAGKYAYQSLTEHAHEAVALAGGDPDFLIRAQESQGWHSWNYESCKMKIVELALRGMTPDEAIKKGMFDGTSTGHEADWAKAIDYYKNNKAELELDKKAVAAYKSAVTTFLENSNIKNVDKAEKTITVVRTEKDFTKKYGIKQGELCDYSISCAESAAHDAVVYIYGNEAYVMKVPLSRVMGCYWWERGTDSNNKNHGPYLGDGEHEIGVDAFASPFPKLFVGKSHDYDDAVRQYNDAMKKWNGVMPKMKTK